MSITERQNFAPSYDCLVEDLVDGKPATTNGLESWEEGTTMTVWTAAGGDFSAMYKRIDGEWNKLA